VKIGDLIRYWNMDSEPVHGIITSHPFVDEELGDEKRVTVHWFDDSAPTNEEVGVLLDPAMDYMDIISESR